jgi:hypothetical protein
MMADTPATAAQSKTRDAALAGRGDQRQVARAGNQQKHNDGDDKSTVVSDADK